MIDISKPEVAGARLTLRAGMLVLLGLGAAAGTAFGAENNGAPAEPYTWSAELLEYDAASNMATFRSRLASHAAISDSAELESGEAMYLTWSGLHFANAVRTLSRDVAQAPSSLTLPVRFEALERDGRYVSYSLRIPAPLTEAVAALQPGLWVTATSPRHPFDSQEAIIDIRSYNDVD